MSTSNSWCPGRCQVCGAGATTQINGAEWYCAIHVPNRPLSYPLAGRPEDLAEIARLRDLVAELARVAKAAMEMQEVLRLEPSDGGCAVAMVNALAALSESARNAIDAGKETK